MDKIENIKKIFGEIYKTEKEFILSKIEIVKKITTTSNHKIYFVGGYVRDKILGIKSKDVDFVFVIDNCDNTKLTIEEGFNIMNNWLISEGFSIFLSTSSVLTIRAKFPQSANYLKFNGLTADFVLARKEEYIDGSRKPIVKIGTLKDDLERRDFTINAIAMDLDGNIIDLFDGLSDLDKMILRTPLDPYITLNDDPLRLLRALRFNITKKMSFEPKLMNQIENPEIINKLFTLVSGERIREELQKMFEYSTPDTLRLLTKIDIRVPNFINRLFSNGLWLKPTTEKNKKIE